MTENRPSLDVLWPIGPEPVALAPDPEEAELSELYRSPHHPWLRANMISTLDGAATGADERSGSINSPPDNRVFHMLRGLADVIVVGAGTVRAEGYRAPRVGDAAHQARLERGQAPHPALAVVTGSGDLPVPLLTDDPAPWVFTTGTAPHLDRLREHLPADRLHIHEAQVDLAAVSTTLADAGLAQQLNEGGPRLLAALLSAGLVDELCLTWTPSAVAGPAPRIVRSPAWLEPSVPARLAHLLHSDGVLLARWLLG